MPRCSSRFKPWPIFVAMAFCALFQPVSAVAQQSELALRLEQTESLRTRDHTRFLQQLATLHQQASAMSIHERWQLRYLDAWQAAFQGDYPHANVMLQDVIDHSRDQALVTKASAVLMDDVGVNKHYVEAFELANQLVVDLPRTQDKLARFMALFYVSQLLASAGQYDLAAQHIREMAQTLPPDETSCKPTSLLMSTLYDSHKLQSSSPELQHGIDACQTAGEPVFGNTIQLVKASLYLDEDQPQKAIALLNQIAPAINASQYYSHLLSLQVELAQAYWKAGDDGNARKAALAAIAISDPGDINGSLKDVYQLLYSIEKKRGNTASALAYYERFVEQNTGYLNDLSARALAFDEAQQHVLAQKLETEKLNKQNNVLQLQQALDKKAVETGRLYIALLLVALASIGFWLLRLKRSQLRFKELSAIDGLTGIYNHQHFMSAAGRALHQLEKRSGSACLAFIDLDHFKQVNDNHGHAMGDDVLKRAVTICKQHLRPTDLFGRLGGEEFAILLQDCSSEGGRAIANRIRLAMEAARVEGNGNTVSFSASVGVASTVSHGYELQQLCREADAALYRAKRAGRNCVIADSANESLFGT
jgi:diguanylate cyclase (GGDEF)-like protein